MKGRLGGAQTREKQQNGREQLEMQHGLSLLHVSMRSAIVEEIRNRGTVGSLGRSRFRTLEAGALLSGRGETSRCIAPVYGQLVLSGG